MQIGWMVAAAALAVGSAANADVVREGSGERRAALDRMELTRMPASWDDLASWRGEAVTRSTTAGKPVLIVTWASWYPRSVRALSTAQRLADQFGEDGLVVVGVHHKDGWEHVDTALSSREVTFPIAHDVNGTFRDTLMVDNDPDYYLIDRAGQLRFADIASSSLEEAVTIVVGESEHQAGSIEMIRAQREAAANAEQEQLFRINSEIDELADIEVPFIAPGELAYKDLSWPVLSEQALQDIGIRRAGSGRGSNNNEPPPDIRVDVPQGTFYPAAPVVKGRVVAVYMWHPDIRASYWPDMNDMDVLQRKQGRDLRVVGVMVPKRQLLSSQDAGDETVEELTEEFEKFTRARNFDHTLVLDAAGALMDSFGGRARSGRNSTSGTSRLLLLSSDGVLRWVGHMDTYAGPLDRMLRIDPGVKARREAERAFIEGRN